MLTHYLAFFGSWILGIIILFLMLKNSNHSLKPGDILFTLILSVALSVVFSFAAEKANLFHWATCIAFAFLGGFVTYKFLDKQYQPTKFFTALLVLSSLTFSSCSHYVDDPTKSVWSEGLWLIPALLAIGFVVFGIRAWIAYNSGTIEGGGLTKDGRNLGPVHDVTGPNGEKIKPPMYKNGNFWFAVIFFVAFWVVVYVVNNGK